MFGIINILGRKAGNKAMSAAVTLAALTAIGSPAVASERPRTGPTLSQREIVQREANLRDSARRDHCEERVTRVWVPPEYRTVCDRVYIQPVYEERCSRIWIEPVYEDRCERIWIEPVYETRCDRVWIEPVYEVRCVTRFDPVCGRMVTVHERVCVQPGRWDMVHRKVCVREGRWDEVRRRVCVREGRWQEVKQRVCVQEGRWQNVDRQVLVREGYWTTRTERVGVADRNDRRPIEVLNPHIRF